MNLNMHLGFSTLSESERHCAGCLNRIAEDAGWSKPEENAGHYFVFPDIFRRVKDDPKEGHLVEALLTALIMQDKRVAFRALLQAQRYDALLERDGEPHHPDALRIASHRVSNLLTSTCCV